MLILMTTGSRVSRVVREITKETVGSHNIQKLTESARCRDSNLHRNAVECHLLLPGIGHEVRYGQARGCANVRSRCGEWQLFDGQHAISEWASRQLASRLPLSKVIWAQNSHSGKPRQS